MTGWPRVGFIAGTLGLGGAERQLWEQCRVLLEVGAPPVVLSLDHGGHWEGGLRDLGIDPVWVGRRSGRFVRLATILRHLSSARVDVVQASHGMTNVYAALAGRVLHRPSVGALRTTPEGLVAGLGVLGRPSLRWPDRLAGNSRRNLEACTALGVDPSRSHLVPNAIDLDRFVPSGPGRVDTGSDGADPQVLFVGRLGPEKRVEVLIDAVAMLRRKGLDTSAAIVGDGPTGDSLRERARDLGVDNMVTFVGRDQPDRWYSRTRVLVLPSEREGTPNVVLEALASGVPVIATPVGDVEDLVGTAGRIVPVGDADALAAALTELMTNRAAYEAAAAQARQRAVAAAGRPALAAAMGDLYCSLTARRFPCAA